MCTTIPTKESALWVNFSLKTRIYLVLAALVCISLIGSLVMIWYTYQMDRIMVQITEKEFATFQAAEALETALVNQKGFVAYYFLEGNPEWLRQLGEYRRVFQKKLKETQSLAIDHSYRQAIDEIATEYQHYTQLKDQVIGHYKAGRRNEGTKLHQEARKSFFKIMELCEAYKQQHVERMQQQVLASREQASDLRLTAAVAVLVSLFLVGILAVIFIREILRPVAQLVRETGDHVEMDRSDNIVTTLSRKVHGLIADVDQTQTALRKSQEHLMQSEKLAMVGKLAAGMAHSIRNPFTSVKMRLFSLERTLALTDDQQEDFQVISEEIRHIDTIVQNFLEFSRPPKLIMQRISPSVVVDRSLQLLSHRLKSYNVKVQVIRIRNLPHIQADPEQLKEVLVNLLINACEAMQHGGEIVIREEVIQNDPAGPVAIIRVSDSGPGVPANLQEKILQPFFTTKEEGSGLGLSIATRIIEEHAGELTYQSKPGYGASFYLKLPIEESASEHDSDH
jgi:signal transduction histidine kinase